jgi:hypothetical protein
LKLQRLAGDGVAHDHRRLIVVEREAEPVVADAGDLGQGCSGRKVEETGLVAPSGLAGFCDEQDLRLRRCGGGMIGHVELAEGGVCDDAAPQLANAG